MPVLTEENYLRRCRTTPLVRHVVPDSSMESDLLVPHRHYARLFGQPRLKDADAAGWPQPDVAVAGRRGSPPAFPD